MQNFINFLNFLNDNWTSLLIIIGLLIGLYQKIKAFLNEKKDVQIKTVKTIIKEVILDLVAKAEKDYAENKGAGTIKRSQVIKQLYDDYPILSKISDQEEVLKLIDTEIDNALENIQDVFKKD